LKVLEDVLLDEEDGQVLVALQFLGEMGPAAKPVAPTLVAMLKHTDKGIRAATIEALKKIDPQSVLKKATD
jgi:hypothetical protein